MNLKSIHQAIINDPDNHDFLLNNWKPIYVANKQAKVLIISQSPGRVAQETGIPWNDKSGDNLRHWLGVDKRGFYDTKKFAIVPMDFYFPGRGIGGDLPPRKGFAQKWHPLILKQMPNISLTILLGQYAQKMYLGDKRKQNLTQTVQSYKEYLPQFLPLVHPSLRNNIWQKKNPWFKKEIPTFQKVVRNCL
jgi:uracil-DNA glycosylase